MATGTNQTTRETPVVRTATEAREGVTGHGVRYVLMFSIALVVILFGVIWLYYFR